MNAADTLRTKLTPTLAAMTPGQLATYAHTVRDLTHLPQWARDTTLDLITETAITNALRNALDTTP